jgi:SAM-dependent methyltransferase
MRKPASRAEAAGAVVDIQLSRFTQMVFGYWMSGAVFGIVRSGVAELLDSGPRSAAEIATRLGADAEMVDSLCHAGVAVGLLLETDGVYSWSPLGERFLSSDSPESLANWARIMDRWQEAWRDMGQAVRDSGKRRRKAGHALAGDPDYERDMARGFYEFAALTSDAVAEALAIDEGLVVDVGSGPGAYAIAVCRRAPSVRAALIDRPATLEIAAEMVARAGFADRIEMHARDYLRDPYPGPATAVLISNMLHSEPRPNRGLLFANAREALAPGGRLLVHGHFVGPGGGGVFTALQGLSSAVLWDVGGGITVDGTLAEIEEAGFECLDPVSIRTAGTVLLIGVRP